MEFLSNFVRDAYMGARRQMPVATRRAFAPALSPGQIFSSAKPPVTAPGAILGVTGRLWGPIGLAPQTIAQAQKVFNPDDNIITSLRDLGGGLYNLTQGKPYLEGHSRSLYSPKAQEATRQAQIQYADRAKGSLQGPPVPEFTPVQPIAADRAYQQEKSRVAQLAAQDELSKKYNVADLTKAYNTASTPEEKEKIGLQIWATTNPQLAQKLKPGQLGYQETQAVAASQSPLGEAMKAVGNMQYTDKISFGAVPATDFGIGLQTPLSGMQVPSIPQVGVAEAFKETTPGGMSFSEAAEIFKGQLPGQADAATLKKLFEQGLKK